MADVAVKGGNASGPADIDTITNDDNFARQVFSLSPRDGTNVELLAKTAGLAPAAGTASVIATGGTAVDLITGPINGGYITNPPNDDSQGVAVENLYIDLVGVPGSTDATGNGTTTILFPGQNFDVPAIGAGHVIRANAATSGHKVTVVVW